MDHRDVAEFRGAGYQRIEEDGWGCSGALKIELLTAADAGNSFLRSDDLHGRSLGAAVRRARVPFAPKGSGRLSRRQGPRKLYGPG
jgi:hypothetical protein